jgi:hypothetical protein
MIEHPAKIAHAMAIAQKTQLFTTMAMPTILHGCKPFLIKSCITNGLRILSPGGEVQLHGALMGPL